MASSPTEMRMMVRVEMKEDRWEKYTVVKDPHLHSSMGGPPDVLQEQGVEQIIVIRENVTVLYRWVTLKLCYETFES